MNDEVSLKGSNIGNDNDNTIINTWTCKDIPVSASDFVPSRLLIDQLCISIFQIYSTENIMIK
jgi:hypothetical protein